MYFSLGIKHYITNYEVAILLYTYVILMHRRGTMLSPGKPAEMRKEADVAGTSTAQPTSSAEASENIKRK